MLRIREILERNVYPIILKVHIAYLRIEAHDHIRKVVRKNGTSVVNMQVKKNILEYCRRRFGKTVYWPYLALYTEIRGEFIEGWLPYDYYKCIMLPKINPRPEVYLNDQKTFDYRLFGDFAVKPLFLFISGFFFNIKLEVVDKNHVREVLRGLNDMIVIKEEKGQGGKQVRIIHSTAFDPTELVENKNYVIQPYIHQYKVLNDLNPESVNTFRVNTFISKDGAVSVKCVLLRFGVNHSKIDNLSAGGQCVYFSSSGEHSEWSYDDFGFKLSDRHPETGFVYADIQIPMFNDMLDKCKKAHKKYPYVRLIGWDVCISSAGEPKLIEWNAYNPSFWPEEAKFGPFFKNEVIL